MATTDSDILILGAGIFGTSTAYHLSLTHPSPHRITILDRSPSPSPQAASTDINKIVRADYGTPFYMALAYEALDAWEGEPWLKKYFHRTGWVCLDEEGSDLSERIRENFKRSGREDTSADIELGEVRRGWGGVLRGIKTEGFAKAYTNSSAGWADASGAVEGMMRRAVENGVRYRVGEVEELGWEDGRVVVRVEHGDVYTARQIVLATGAWTPWLMAGLELSLNIPAEQSIDRQIQAAGVCVAAFKLTPEQTKHYDQMPVLIYGGQGEVLPPTKSSLFKFTNSNTFLNTVQYPSGKQISVPDPDQHAIPPGLQQESIDIIRSRIPEILDSYSSPHEWRLCWDAVSPDQNQLICQHPDPRLSNLYFATAGSFHSWKFLPIIGKYVDNVLRGESNGPEKDAAWAWKTQFASRGAHEKVLPTGELRDR